ncbi:DNA excision repair protein ERCC-1 like protein [Argiope bruennichi]|uniref:DNA excision repair protein ERCC-1 like protein n=1 Tax=Argiope bruennichi TaxID=94029 RepID=A0A8T0DZZ6_ARGBR|nr:DNA excision repair protein ERCC-1 like protein [Argiope bruennichi]
MEKSPKKFCIPKDTDDSFEDSVSVAPRYFKPGQIICESSREENTLSSETNTSSVPDAPKIENKQPNVTEKVPPRNNVTERRPPTTLFQSEFENLKESKFYDKSIETCSSGVSGTSRSVSALIVNPRQRGNPLLKHIRNVPWEFSEIEPDYLMGKSACALFLSLRYHNLFPNYIHDRLKALGKSYSLRVLLVQVDVAEPNPPLKDLSVISILADCTLMVAWSAEEAGMYLETYKMFENKSADLIKEKQDSDHYSQLIDCLTTIRSINKTDATVLLSNFKTLKGIVQASVEDLTQCPGMGPLKVS